MEINIPKRALNMGTAYRQLMLDNRHYVEPATKPDPRPNVPDHLFTSGKAPRPVNPGPKTDSSLYRTDIPRFERPKKPHCKPWAPR